MKILHYLSGLPPVRGGGMIKYALDLAEAQSKTDNVYLLLPGEISVYKKKRGKVKIQKSLFWRHIPTFRIQNPLPIPMANGILDTEWYTFPYKGEAYISFLENLQPDIIHVHTFMGLHSEFLEAAQQIEIPVIYTTHNYFGICPKADLMYSDCICIQPGEACEECCKYAFPRSRIILEQSTLYKIYRQSPFLISALASEFCKKYFKAFRSNFPKKQDRKAQAISANENTDYSNIDDITREHRASKYIKLLSYYQNMFEMITYFHFNSTMTRRLYEERLGKLKGEILGVSNRGIYDRRSVKKVGKKLQIGFLGGDWVYKGKKRLQCAVQELYDNGFSDIELHIYGSTEKEVYAFCKYHNSYTSNELERVFGEMDLLAVPSHEPETFGMVVLEALSFGVPVLVTDKVGAQDILMGSNQTIGVVAEDNIQKLKEAIMDLDKNREKIETMNRNILHENLPIDYIEYVKMVHQMYGRCITCQNSANS